MKTNYDRLMYLQQRIQILNQEIQEKELEDKYIKMCNDIENKVVCLRSTSDEEWDVMLPKEKQRNLLNYYMLLKLEHREMVLKMKETSKLEEWLESPYSKLSLALMTAGPFVSWFYNIVTGKKLFLGEPKKKYRTPESKNKTMNLIQDLKSDYVDIEDILRNTK